MLSADHAGPSAACAALLQALFRSRSERPPGVRVQRLQNDPSLWQAAWSTVCGVSVQDEHVDVIYCGDDVVSCKDKFEGGVEGMDGKIYCIPLRAKSFVNIVPGKK